MHLSEAARYRQTTYRRPAGRSEAVARAHAAGARQASRAGGRNSWPWFKCGELTSPRLAICEKGLFPSFSSPAPQARCIRPQQSLREIHRRGASCIQFMVRITQIRHRTPRRRCVGLQTLVPNGVPFTSPGREEHGVNSLHEPLILAELGAPSRAPHMCAPRNGQFTSRSQAGNTQDSESKRGRNASQGSHLPTAYLFSSHLVRTESMTSGVAGRSPAHVAS